MVCEDKELEVMLMKSFKETVPKMDNSQKNYILGVMQGISMMHKDESEEPKENKSA